MSILKVYREKLSSLTARVSSLKQELNKRDGNIDDLVCPQSRRKSPKLQMYTNQSFRFTIPGHNDL